MDQNGALWFIRQGGNHEAVRKYLTVRWWLDQDTSQVSCAPVMSQARKHGSDKEKSQEAYLGTL